MGGVSRAWTPLHASERSTPEKFRRATRRAANRVDAHPQRPEFVTLMVKQAQMQLAVRISDFADGAALNPVTSCAGQAHLDPRMPIAAPTQPALKPATASCCTAPIADSRSRALDAPRRGAHREAPGDCAPNDRAAGVRGPGFRPSTGSSGPKTGGSATPYWGSVTTSAFRSSLPPSAWALTPDEEVPSLSTNLPKREIAEPGPREPYLHRLFVSRTACRPTPAFCKTGTAVNAVANAMPPGIVYDRSWPLPLSLVHCDTPLRSDQSGQGPRRRMVDKRSCPCSVLPEEGDGAGTWQRRTVHRMLAAPMRGRLILTDTER